MSSSMQRDDDSPQRKVRWASEVVENNNASSDDPVIKGNTTAEYTKTTSPSSSSSSSSSVPLEQQKSTTKEKTPLCTFCGRYPAAVQVKSSVLCLLHYYTTEAVHVESKRTNVLDSDLAHAQLRGIEEGNNKWHKLNVQDLFAEAYVQLQQELQQESLVFSANGSNGNNTTTSARIRNPRKAAPENDPLEHLHDLSRSKKRRKAPLPSSVNAKKNTASAVGGGGGFLQPLTVPERLRKTQLAQAQKQAELVARMNRAASAATKTDLYKNNEKQQDSSKRRRPTRKSIWNSVMDDPNQSKKKGTTTTTQRKKVPNNIFREIDVAVDGVACSCGSTNVDSAGNVTTRQDITKGEVWGGKDRQDDVILRYRCNECGKTWQESV